MSDAPQPSVFAVWRWKWWVWCVIAGMMPPCYLLAAPPIIFFGHIHANIDAFDLCEPALWLSQRSRILTRIYRWEWNTLEAWYGVDKTFTISRGPGRKYSSDDFDDSP